MKKQREKEDELRALRQEIGSNTDSWLDAPLIPIATNLDSIKYPDDDTTTSMSPHMRSVQTVSSFPKL